MTTTWIWIVCVILALACYAASLMLTARLFFRLGFRLGVGVVEKRRRLTAPATERKEVPAVFELEAERRAKAETVKRRERAGMLPWNYRRPGMSKEEREALLFQLEDGKLNKAIDRIVKEETET